MASQSCAAGKMRGVTRPPLDYETPRTPKPAAHRIVSGIILAAAFVVLLLSLLYSWHYAHTLP